MGFVQKRAIKFRDYDFDTKTVRYFDLDRYDRNEHDTYGNTTEFTGRLDMHGKEIYEGDWCRAEFRTKDGIQVIQGHIIMDEFMWCIDCTGSVGDDIFSINRPHNFEVIGNIYENPELFGS